MYDEELRNTANWGRGNEPGLFPYGIIRSSAVEVLAVNGVAITTFSLCPTTFLPALLPLLSLLPS